MKLGNRLSKKLKNSVKQLGDLVEEKATKLGDLVDDLSANPSYNRKEVTIKKPSYNPKFRQWIDKVHKDSTSSGLISNIGEEVKFPQLHTICCLNRWQDRAKTAGLPCLNPLSQHLLHFKHVEIKLHRRRVRRRLRVERSRTFSDIPVANLDDEAELDPPKPIIRSSPTRRARKITAGSELYVRYVVDK